MDTNIQTAVRRSDSSDRILADDFQFSYSSINKLLNVPMIFHKEYILGEREVSTEKYLLEGNLIHYLLLDNESFNSKYIVTSDKLPSPTNIAVAKYVYNNGSKGSSLEDNGDLILECLKELDKHQSLKDTKDGTGDSKRIKKIVEPKTEEYYNFLQSAEGKEIIDSEMLDKCSARVEIIKENYEIIKLLGIEKFVEDYDDVKCEYPLTIDKLPGYDFGLKGILDNVTVKTTKDKVVVTINDFKTTSKGLTNFVDTVEYYRYWLQAAVYVELIKDTLKNEYGSDLKFEIKFNFIVFDTFNQLYIFNVSDETLNSWKRKFKDEVLPALDWHAKNNRYDLPYEFATKTVYL